ncbi:MAG: radical SAM protein [Chloroflexi bacterium]|nr:radical SAM protein [Chloroflexota bacterium]
MSEPRTVAVSRIIIGTVAEGPGVRSAVWVQGCSIRCPGCFNPHTWPVEGGLAMRVPTLIDRLITDDVEGVTFLGGEPFDQAAALAEVAEAVSATGRSVMTFTGFTLEELRRDLRPGVAALLDSTDLLVDGPYDQTSPDDLRPWVGSTNQRFHFLSPRYEHLSDVLEDLPDRLELRITADGSVSVNGFATQDILRPLLEGIGRRAPGTR